VWAWVLVTVLVSARWLAYLPNAVYMQFGTELCQGIRLLVERNKFLKTLKHAEDLASRKSHDVPVAGRCTPTRLPKCTYVEESPTMSCGREGATPSSPSASFFSQAYPTTYSFQ
jgi:hypothetical protein